MNTLNTTQRLKKAGYKVAPRSLLKKYDFGFRILIPMKLSLTLLFVLAATCMFAQESEVNQPTDFLNKDFHLDRRSKLREKLPPNSVAVFFSNAVRNRANDVDYVFHQDPDFFYLTGYREPNSVLLIFKDKQTAANGSIYDDIIFVQARNPQSEMWTGRRLGENGVKNDLGLKQVFTGKEFARYNVDFSKFDQVLFYDFKNDVRDNAR